MSDVQFCAACGEQTPHAPCVHCNADPRLGGRYVLRALLGQGSHGMTWRAEAPDTGRAGEPHTVAIKVINLGQGLQPLASRALDREVAVLRQLSHPCIPSLIDDFSVRSGMTRYRCIVQEFIDGMNLLDELQTTRHTAAQVMATIAEAAALLDHLHTLTPPIIHRDIKPQNIIRRRQDGRLVLIDFGSVRDTIVGTMGGTMSVGTVGYMAPEQITGEICPASDLYALGALAVHLLTRAPPQLTHDPTRPVRWRKPSGLSPHIGAFVDSLLEPSLSKRPSQASVVAQQARDLAEGRPTATAPPEKQPPAPPAQTQPALPEKRKSAPLAQTRPMLPMVASLMVLGACGLTTGIFALLSLNVLMVMAGIGAAITGPVVSILAARRRQWLGALVGLGVPALGVFVTSLQLLGLSGALNSPMIGPVVVACALLLSMALLGALLEAILSGPEPKNRKSARRRKKQNQRSRAQTSGRRTTPGAHGASQGRFGEAEREHIKKMAREWRAGVVPESEHFCPYCDVQVRANNLVRHFDKVHRQRPKRR